MKRDLVQIWVTRPTRQVLKVLAAKNCVTVIEYLHETYTDPYSKEGPNAKTSRVAQPTDAV